MNETIKWIDVDTEMPDDSIEVMIFFEARSHVWIGYWDSESFAWRDNNGEMVTNVTHWAEMPEGPKVPA
jgi:hypothetical protein